MGTGRVFSSTRPSLSVLKQLLAALPQLPTSQSRYMSYHALLNACVHASPPVGLPLVEEVWRDFLRWGRPSGTDYRAVLTCYFHAHRYAEVAALFEKMTTTTITHTISPTSPTTTPTPPTPTTPTTTPTSPTTTPTPTTSPGSSSMTAVSVRDPHQEQHQIAREKQEEKAEEEAEEEAAAESVSSVSVSVSVPGVGVGVGVGLQLKVKDYVMAIEALGLRLHLPEKAMVGSAVLCCAVMCAVM